MRYGALLSGAVDATMAVLQFAKQAAGQRISHPRLQRRSCLVAERESGEHRRQNSNSPAEVYRVVKATLKGHLFFHRNAKETMKFIMEVLGMSNPTKPEKFGRARVKQASELAQVGGLRMRR